MSLNSVVKSLMSSSCVDRPFLGRSILITVLLVILCVYVFSWILYVRFGFAIDGWQVRLSLNSGGVFLEGQDHPDGWFFFVPGLTRSQDTIRSGWYSWTRWSARDSFKGYTLSYFRYGINLLILEILIAGPWLAIVLVGWLRKRRRM